MSSHCQSPDCRSCQPCHPCHEEEDQLEACALSEVSPTAREGVKERADCMLGYHRRRLDRVRLGVLELEEESVRSSWMKRTASRRLMRTPATSTLSCMALVPAKCSRKSSSEPPDQAR